MNSPSFLQRLLSGFVAAFDPLRQAVASPDAFAGFLKEFGWTLVPADATKASGSLSGISALTSDPSSLSLDQLASQIASAVAVIRNLTDSGIPAAIASTLPGDLLDFLVYLAAAQRSPMLFGLLHFVGVISEQRVPADAATGRGEYIARRIHWARLSGLTNRPLETIQGSYGWGTNFDGDGFLRSVAILLRGFGALAGMYPTDQRLIAQYFSNDNPAGAGLRSLIISPPFLDATVSLDSAAASIKLALLGMPIPPTATASAPVDGLVFLPVITGQTTDTLSISDTISLRLTGDFLARPVRAEIHPTSAVVRGSAGDAHVSAGARVDVKAPSGTKWIPLGDAGSTRFEVSAVHASLGMDGQLDGNLDLTVELGIDAAALVIDLGQGDGFLQGTVGSQTSTTAISFAVKCSTVSGFSLSGQPRLAITIPVGRSLGGGVTLISAGVELGTDGGPGVHLDGTVSLSTAIGPIGATISDTGLRMLLTFPKDGGNLGVANLELGFKSPSGIGLSVDAHGVLTGGGFLFHDPAQQLYAGVMQLSLHDELTLSAYGLITTKMPDGGRGYSLLIFITAEDFKPIPLGFGFMLQSIGGMVGVNRTFDQDVIKAGLQTDTLATLLFPRDPVANAPALIQALAAAFPAREGSYLLGLLARITWFEPTLVQLDLALILEFGARTRLLVLGRVSALLPSADNDLIRLKLDSIGVLDFDEGTLAVDAVLVDSRLAHQFPITGSGALRARWSGATNFVLAVGGFNPRFAPPAGFPALERVAIAFCSGDNPRLVSDAYFAITANTVQFGANTSLYAEALGFSVTGDFGYDALVTIEPPHFIIDFHASMQLKHGSHNLFKVTLDGTLEGPVPLRLAARASFEILWVSFTVHFNYTLVDGDPAQASLAAVDLTAELAKALADAASWSTRRASALAHGVALRSLPSGAGAVLDPLGQLVVQQQVVPLDTSRDVDTYGGAPVAGAHRFQVSATLNGQTGTPVSGAFAPARYFVMSDDDKLVAPSFETMDAGLVLGAGAMTFDADPQTVVPADLIYDEIVLNPLTTAHAPALNDAAPSKRQYAMPPDALKVHLPTGAAARVPVRRVGRVRFRNAAAPPAAKLTPLHWRIVQASDGNLAPEQPPVTTWSEYRTALATLNRGGAHWLIAPLHELPKLTEE